MSEMKITFKHPDEILDFVNTVSKYEFDMDMKKGHVVSGLQILRMQWESKEKKVCLTSNTH